MGRRPRPLTTLREIVNGVENAPPTELFLTEVNSRAVKALEDIQTATIAATIPEGTKLILTGLIKPFTPPTNTATRSLMRKRLYDRGAGEAKFRLDAVDNGKKEITAFIPLRHLELEAILNTDKKKKSKRLPKKKSSRLRQ